MMQLIPPCGLFLGKLEPCLEEKHLILVRVLARPFGIRLEVISSQDNFAIVLRILISCKLNI
ncbi:MAG: hypothetical protein A2Y62_13475 [Candidatus Fischerbacteria bacterium RBG_13_37_8]|uniref:Uncharacterized protein n=1 Tax=Candidatus Fischerbacteria bacterium RBG_13_37_8 TaxID=1817863 RepID=A0A1F5VLV6_9BACT|nr:MAG: hypothetical protein A2Y62_13475 [Candidatus Fischerbacteria bacterium RBG_13_37_8]